MRRLERIEDLNTALLEALRGWQANLWTAMPGIVQSYDGLKNTCVVQPAIMAEFRGQDGVWSPPFRMPLCLDVLVVWPGGGGFTMTFPLTEGDEVLLIWAARCIDGWYENGVVSPQPEYRMHSLSDGFALPQPRSRPNVVAGGIARDSCQLRSNDGTTYVEIAMGGVVNVVAPGGLNITGDVIITGDVSTSGALLNQGVDVGSLHRHIDTQPGGGLSGTPQP